MPKPRTNLRGFLRYSYIIKIKLQNRNILKITIVKLKSFQHAKVCVRPKLL